MEESWSRTTKRTIVIGSIIVLFLFLGRIRPILTPVAIALILAYILSPIASFFSRQLRLNRTFVVVIIYLILVAIIITVPAVFIPPLIERIQSFVENTPQLIKDIGEFIQQPVVIGDFTLDLQDVYDLVSSSLQGVLSSMGTQMINILTNIASAVLWMLFVLVASFYLVKDAAIITRWLDEATPSAFRDDARLLKTQITAAWNAFLRGQLILCVVMGLVVGTTMALIGLPNAWLIGLLFGLLEFIPNLGPTIASVPTILIAYLEGSTVLNLSNGWFAVLVIAINFALQQLENNFLVPRIMGHSLNLHPLVVLVAAIIGAHLAGVLGILLAAPVVATLRVLAEYTYYRLLDMPPFPRRTAPSQAETQVKVAGAEVDAPPLSAQPATAEVSQGDEQALHSAPPLAAAEGKQTE
jgi:predicted PurR-regulated permease PerM